MTFTPLVLAPPLDPAPTPRGEAGALAPGALIERVYGELRSLAAARLGSGGEDGAAAPPFSPTTLVHAAYLDLTDRGLLRHVDRATLLAAAAEAMGQVLAEEARERDERLDKDALSPAIAPRIAAAEGRPTDAIDDWIALEEAVGALEIFDPVRARLARLRLYAGLPMSEVAALMDLALRSLEREWRYTRAWLQNRVRGEERRPRRAP